MAAPSERPPMRVVPLEKKPSRARFVALGLLWLVAGTSALTYLATRPPSELAHVR